MVKEETIAGAVVTYLEQQAWDVYQEVEYVGSRADIVATSGFIVRVVEVKTSLTAALVEQAWGWKPWAHYVHIAVPKPKIRHRVPGRSVLLSFCLAHGIGIFHVQKREPRWSEQDERKSKFEIKEAEMAKLNRKALAAHFRNAIRPEHKNWGRAGNADNKYYTPWRGTCEAWRAYIKQHPGCSIKELVDKVGHHYQSDSTARSCMSGYLRNGTIPGVEVRRNKSNKIELYSKQAGRGRRPASTKKET